MFDAPHEAPVAPERAATVPLGRVLATALGRLRDEPMALPGLVFVVAVFGRVSFISLVGWLWVIPYGWFSAARWMVQADTDAVLA